MVLRFIERDPRIVRAVGHVQVANLAWQGVARAVGIAASAAVVVVTLTRHVCFFLRLGATAVSTAAAGATARSIVYSSIICFLRRYLASMCRSFSEEITCPLRNHWKGTNTRYCKPLSLFYHTMGVGGGSPAPELLRILNHLARPRLQGGPGDLQLGVTYGHTSCHAKAAS